MPAGLPSLQTMLPPSTPRPPGDQLEIVPEQVAEETIAELPTPGQPVPKQPQAQPGYTAAVPGPGRVQHLGILLQAEVGHRVPLRHHYRHIQSIH